MDPETSAALPLGVDADYPPPPLPPPPPAPPARWYPTIGRVVDYVLPEGPSAGQDRPALIVRVWNETSVNLQVFHDGDGTPHFNDGLTNVVWKTSVAFNAAEKPGTWHWPEGAPAPV